MDAESARVEHLKFIQALIDRMARNSFAIKAGSSTVVAALIAVTLSSTQPPIAAIGGIVLLMFWVLDVFYLRQERLFRELYDSTRCGPPPEFGSQDYFRMVIRSEGNRLQTIISFLKVMFWRTMPIFYVPLLILLLLSAVVANESQQPDMVVDQNGVGESCQKQ